MRISISTRLVAIATFFCLSLMCIPGRAAIVMALQGNAATASPITIALSDLTTSPDATVSSTNSDVGVAGFLSSGSGSFDIEVEAFGSMTIGGGSVLTLGDSGRYARSATRGWGVENGPTSGKDIGNDGTSRNALTFTFDLSSLTLPANTELRLIGVTVNLEAGTPEVELSDDGISSGIIGTATGVANDYTTFVTSVDLSDGSLIALSVPTTSAGEEFRVRSFEFETFTTGPPVPEPHTLGLFAFSVVGLIGFGRRRKR